MENVDVGPLPSVYALFLVFTYTAKKLIELIRLDEDKSGKWANLEKLGLTTVLLVGIAYIVYVLIAIAKKKKNPTKHRPASVAVAANEKVIHPFLHSYTMVTDCAQMGNHAPGSLAVYCMVVLKGELSKPWQS